MVFEQELCVIGRINKNNYYYLLARRWVFMEAFLGLKF